LWTRIFEIQYLNRSKFGSSPENEGWQQRKVYQKTKEYKSGKNANRYAKFAEAHRLQLEDVKTGAKYESGVAVKNKNSLKDAPK